jgi:glycosyltransferase involved in cell wall biosynthesis
VVSLHDLYPFDVPENFGRFRSSVTRAIMRQCIQRVDGIACVSESTRSRLKSWFPALSQKAETIYNVVAPVRRPHEGRMGNSRDERPFVLCVAQHRSNKNVPLAIRIFERVLQQRMLPHYAQLRIVGIPGPETRVICDEIKERRLERNVVMLSGLSDAELYRCYDDCRLLLAPSKTEGFGLPVAEAMLSGCPVVCSDIPAFREIGGDMCHYVAWGDGLLKRFASAVNDALRMPRPAPVLLPQFSSRVIGQKYAAFYERIASPGISDPWCSSAPKAGANDEKWAEQKCNGIVISGRNSLTEEVNRETMNS